MYFPIKFKTITKDSFLVLQLSLPLWFDIRNGTKIIKTLRKRSDVSLYEVESCPTLQVYIIGVYFRIRNNDVMKTIRQNSEPEKKPSRFIIRFYRGWQQVFESGVV